MIDALPPGVLQLSHRVTGIVDEGDGVRVEFEEQSPVTVDIVVGADGIDSLVRRTLWGDSPVLEHDLHIIGGYFLVDGEVDTRGVWAHGRTVQGSYTPIRHEGRFGYEWWVLEAWPHGTPFTNAPRDRALQLASHFAAPLPEYIRRTAPEDTYQWQIRDRLPLAQWSKGRVTIIGDAAGDGYPSQDGLTFGSQAELAVYNVLVELQRDFPVRNAFAVLPLPGARLRDTAVRTPDFVVIGNGRAVVIEVDGPHHSGRNRRADDADRDLHWRRCGVATIRIASEHASDPRSLKARLEEELKRDLRAT